MQGVKGKHPNPAVEQLQCGSDLSKGQTLTAALYPLPTLRFKWSLTSLAQDAGMFQPHIPRDGASALAPPELPDQLRLQRCSSPLSCGMEALLWLLQSHQPGMP